MWQDQCQRYKTMKNKDLQVETIGKDLEGRSIALCVTGGIAAIETPKVARHFRRYSADVQAYATESALKFIGKTALEWATEKEVVSELSGLAEHICMHDAVVVAPATINSINKIFYGLADNSVTALVASALGNNTPVFLAPTMHESLYNNPFLRQNLERAEEYGIKIIDPRGGEGKAKMPRISKITSDVIKYFKEEPGEIEK